MAAKRPIRIAGCSGAATDRRLAMAQLAANAPNDPIDVIIGDWMSEFNMTARAGSITDSPDVPAYEPTFLEALAPAIENIAKYKIRLAVNAGASDTKRLAEAVREMAKKKGLKLSVAWVSGDECFPAVQKAVKEGRTKFENICTGEVLSDWTFEPIYAQAYLGGLGIVEAFKRGADIVVCGRVSDASPVIASAVWWHGWGRHELDKLANAFVGGHLIECSSYVTGGNYTGFKDLESKGWDDMAYPIAEIDGSGQVVITKQKGKCGEVSVGTCTSQLLYEIQGPWYFNSDVTANLDGLWFEQLGADRVALRGVTGSPPPPTTKIGITAKGGYQAEMNWFLTGLDIDAKARMIEAQMRKMLAPHIHKFTMLEFTQNGSVPDNPTNQNKATVNFRVFAQAKEQKDLSPSKFLRPCVDPIMEGYPGATCHLDLRLGFPKPIFEYWVTLLPQSDIQHQVHLESGEAIDIPPPALDSTRTYPKQQPSQDVTARSVDMSRFGRTVRGPLGWIVHGRSGDKGSNCNVGFWVRHKDEWDWLRGLLSTETMKYLLAEEYNGKKIVRAPDRFELPNAYGVHFLLHDHLDRGASCSSRYDCLGKQVAEFCRARYVDLPVKFLSRGML
ncbi:DUF1446-domain-containing protein [Rhizodiscina lignyota]|uniref:DUF1446-domain-containing protein n=1 Tax=Rhizodiscina lignyota TaxID=1504668 RepID=A0A9P4I7J9_9PEZI|nr:DUF1446-domain-containing protein [Rhizodiscina lignyota]